MAYQRSDWLERMKSRSDLCAQVTHLSRAATIGGTKRSSIDVIIKILRECTIKGSTTETGFIVGNRPAVCFQEAPPHSLAQNIVYEEKLHKKVKNGRQRYSSTGLMFPKPYVFQKGGRPVIYDKTEDAKRYLNKNEWWRIVNFSLPESDAFIDWTHEREWRVPENFKFEIEEATVVVGSPKSFRDFERKSLIGGEDVAKKVKAILPIGSVLI